MSLLKQSTARTRAFLLVQTADHLTGATGASPVVTISKNGAAFGAAAGAVAELTNGWYTVAFTTADTGTLGDLAVHVTGTGADPSDWSDEVFAKTVDDLMSTFTLPTNFSALSITAGGLVDITQAAADKVWSSATRTLTSLGAALVQEVWDRATSSLTTAGSIGKLLVDNINATISSRMATFTLPTNFSSLSITAGGLVDITQAAADKVWSSATRTLTAFSTALAVSVWDVLDANITTASSVGLRLKGLTFTTANKVDATIQAAGDFAQAAADKVWLTATRALTDKVGFALSSAGVAAIWDALLTGITTVGSIGKLIKDDLDATITSVKALLPAALVGGRMDSSVGAMAAGVITSAAHAASAIDAAALATDAVNEIRDAVGAMTIEGSTTLIQSQRLHNAALGGKSNSHAAGTPKYRDIADVKNRIDAVTDADGNRTTVTLDLS